MTLLVSDLSGAIDFFALLGFEQQAATVISGERFASFLGVDGLEADHVVLAVPGISPRFEVQLMHYRSPAARPAAEGHGLRQLGFNHICFAVADMDATLARLEASGVEVRGKLDGFYDRRLCFVTGPDGITIELSQSTA